MAVERSFILPKGELTATDTRNFREAAIAAGLSRASVKLGVAQDELVVRQFYCLLDAGTALEQWNTAALAVVGTAYSVFQAIAAPILAQNKLAVFYGCGVETAPCPVGLLTFRSGGAAGNIKAEFDLERIVNSLETEGYFSMPIPWDPTEQMAIQATARIATALLARLQVYGFLIESIGARIARM
jgi:hypothetical protein